MTAMADEGTTETAGGSKPELQPTGEPEGVTKPADAGKPGPSPFLGKLVAPKPTTTLNPETRAGQHTEPPVVSENTKRETPEPSTVRAEDALYGGNIVAETELRRSVAPNASKRSLKEVGLLPRVTDPGKEAPPVDKPESGGGAGKEGSAPKIRTYAADISEEIKKRGETLSTIIGAEQNRLREEPKTQPATPDPREVRRFVMVAGAGMLVLAGVAIIGAVFLFMQNGEEVVSRTPVIPPNATYAVDVSAETRLSRLLASERANAQINLGEVAEIRILENGTPMLASQLLTQFGAPSVLSRNALDYMVGLHAFNRTQPFILISIAPTSYDLAFEAMLEWEERIGEGLEAFFAPNGANPSAAPALRFVDRVYQNVDVRESEAEWRIVYAFPRRDLLLITTNESTLREVLTRLTLSSGQ